MNKLPGAFRFLVFPPALLLTFVILLNPVSAVEPDTGAQTQQTQQTQKKSEPWQQFFDTAKKYSDEAAQALQSAETDVSNQEAWKEIAGNAQKMAEIKTKAGELGKKGIWGDFDWSEYHKLEGRNNELKSSISKAGKSGEKSVQTDKTKEVEKAATGCGCCTCPPAKTS